MFIVDAGQSLGVHCRCSAELRCSLSLQGRDHQSPIYTQRPRTSCQTNPNTTAWTHTTGSSSSCVHEVQREKHALTEPSSAPQHHHQR
ncbi:hypothetical protein RRG08_038266 [Elysia crispata]|uniref:Uncharacterized protein n=1 Tax=Elysia crispata TaxID=231223 RepID=A0AAE1AMR5_9GAST|nr:hypothetical protein RRG08_038266 [Elysia crispata]